MKPTEENMLSFIKNELVTMQNSPPKSHSAIGRIIELKYDAIKFFSLTFFSKNFFRGYENKQDIMQTMREMTFTGNKLSV